MNKCIIWKNATGDTYVTHPSPQIRLASETDQQLAERIRDRDIPGDATEIAIIDKSDLPSRFYRDEWDADGVGAKIDIPIGKARNVKMKAIRAERRIKLDDSDREHMKRQAIYDPTDQERIDYDTFRQGLRDVPGDIKPTVDAETDLDALEALQPTWPTEPA